MLAHGIAATGHGPVLQQNTGIRDLRSFLSPARLEIPRTPATLKLWSPGDIHAPSFIGDLAENTAQVLFKRCLSPLPNGNVSEDKNTRAYRLGLKLADEALANRKIQNADHFNLFLVGYELHINELFRGAGEIINVLPPFEFTSWLERRFHITLERTSFSVAYLVKDGKESISYWKSALEEYLLENSVNCEELSRDASKDIEQSRLIELFLAIEKRPGMYFRSPLMENFVCFWEGMIQAERDYRKSSQLHDLKKALGCKLQVDLGYPSSDFDKILLVSHLGHSEGALKQALREINHLLESDKSNPEK